MRYISFLFLVLLSIFIASCFTPQKAQDLSFKTPSNFHNQNTDSATWANLQWKQFFKDPDLQNLIDSALRYNQEFNILLQNIETARVFYTTSKKQLFPNLNIQASGSTQKFGEYTPSGLDAIDSQPLNLNGNKVERLNPASDFGLFLSSSWEVDIWGKLRAAKKSAKARLEASEQGRQFAQTLLISSVAKAYYLLLALDAEIEIVVKNLKLQEDALEISKVQLSAGKANRLAVQKFEAQLFNTKAQQSLLLRERTNAEQTINILMGRIPQIMSRTSNLQNQTFNFVPQLGVPSQLLLNRPDIKEASLLLQAAGLDILSAQKSLYPSIVINPFVGLNALKSSLLFQTQSLSYGISGGLFAPIFDRYTLRGQLLMKQAAQKQAFLNYEKTIVQAMSEVHTSLRNINFCQLQIKDKSQEVSLLDSAVVTAKDLYLYGYANYYEVISAQKDVLTAEVELINYKKEQLFLFTDLYKALGGGR